MYLNVNVIDEAQRVIKKDLRRNVNTLSLINLIKSMGYKVIFYELKKGGSVLKNLGVGVEEYAKRKDGFTYEGEKGNFVFIDKALLPQAQLCILAHEIGHIVMKHLDIRKEERNRLQEEMEAETFAYILMRFYETGQI